MRFAKNALWTMAGLALCLLSQSPAKASTINYAFTVTATTGPLTGTIASGTFSLDSSSVTPGSTNSNAGLFTSLNFTWDGIVYNQTTANTGNLTFNPSGIVTNSAFGSNCIAGTCSASAGVENWFISANVFAYAISGNRTSVFFGTATVSPTPEPSAFALLGLGLSLIFVRRRTTVPNDRQPATVK